MIVVRAIQPPQPPPSIIGAKRASRFLRECKSRAAHIIATSETRRCMLTRALLFSFRRCNSSRSFGAEMSDRFAPPSLLLLRNSCQVQSKQASLLRSAAASFVVSQKAHRSVRERETATQCSQQFDLCSSNARCAAIANLKQKS